MIITRLTGGVANTLWQYGFGLAMSEKYHTNLGFDISNYQTDTLRQYSLSLFGNIRVPIVTPHNYKYIRENGLAYNSTLIKSVRDYCVLDGYWQSPKYIEPVIDKLRKNTIPTLPLPESTLETIGKIKEAKDRSCFLTIRRTDYVGNSYHNLLTMDYYEKALDEVAKVCDPIAFCFSDDPEWCRENLKFKYPIVISGNWYRTLARGPLGREDAELYAMSMCRHGVAANSSYSIWAACMMDPVYEKERVIVAPKKWFCDGVTDDPKDICKENWIRI